jgi:mannose/fructose/N-acetylgalactosamine-specific phosphotransferase system component IIB
MIKLVRVDDRLLHGQTLYAWVPFVKADLVVVASDEVDCNAFARAVLSAYSDRKLRVIVKRVKEAVKELGKESLANSRVVLIVSDLRDAMRIYNEGLRFTSLNIGDVHHMAKGRRVSRSVMLNKGDEEIIEEFERLGVTIDIRDIPSSPSVPYQRGFSDRQE